MEIKKKLKQNNSVKYGSFRDPVNVYQSWREILRKSGFMCILEFFQTQHHFISQQKKISDIQSIVYIFQLNAFIPSDARKAL